MIASFAKLFGSRQLWRVGPNGRFRTWRSFPSTYSFALRYVSYLRLMLVRDKASKVLPAMKNIFSVDFWLPELILQAIEQFTYALRRSGNCIDGSYWEGGGANSPGVQGRNAQMSLMTLLHFVCIVHCTTN